MEMMLQDNAIGSMGTGALGIRNMRRVSQDSGRHSNSDALYTKGLKVCIATIFHCESHIAAPGNGILTHHQPIKFLDASAFSSLNKLIRLARMNSGDAPRTSAVLFANEECMNEERRYARLIESISTFMDLSHAFNMNPLPRQLQVRVITYRRPLEIIAYSPLDGTWMTEQHGTNTL